MPHLVSQISFLLLFINLMPVSLSLTHLLLPLTIVVLCWFTILTNYNPLSFTPGYLIVS